jgi:hypothetical protein
VKDPFNENCKPLKKETEENTEDGKISNSLRLEEPIL